MADIEDGQNGKASRAKTIAEMRRAAALRANLARRKEQSRGREDVGSQAPDRDSSQDFAQLRS